MSHFSKEFITWLDTNADQTKSLDQLRTSFLKKSLKTMSLKSAYLLSLMA